MRNAACMLVAVIAVVQPAPGQAQPIGIETCDAFIAAYEKCASSPGVPDATRTGMLAGIAAMRTNFAQQAKGDPQVRQTVAAQCSMAHANTRQGLTQAFKCDFPAPTTIVAMPDAATPRPARTQSPEQRTVAKVNLYVEAQNYLVEHRNIADDLAKYVDANARVLGLNPRAPGNDFLQFGIVDFDNAIARLQKALAMPDPVPELDTPATALLEALQAANPIVKALDRYQTTREFREDKYRFAREQHSAFVTRMTAAASATDTFGDALFDRSMAQDEQRVAALPKGSLSQRGLMTSLSARRAIRRFEALDAKGNPAPLAAALAELSSNNAALREAIAAAGPSASRCADYSRDIDTLVGAGRDYARDVREKSSLRQTSEAVVRAYNGSVDKAGRCREG